MNAMNSLNPLILNPVYILPTFEQVGKIYGDINITKYF